MYDKNTEEFEYITGYDESSMFKINTKLTMFEHTTPDMTSSYFVSESEFNEEGNTLTMYVTSDVGNEYLYVFDLEDNEIIVLFKSDETPALLKFSVKKYWTDEWHLNNFVNDIYLKI